jgi:ketosteroid isomerase-like protein
MSKTTEQEILAFLERHLRSVFSRDVDTYMATTSADLSLYEWWVTPHRQDGLDFHLFMIEQGWSGTDGPFRLDLLEPRVQLYGDTAVASYTLMLSQVEADGTISHRTHNESRVLVRQDGDWQVVHVHKSPATLTSELCPECKKRL